MGQTIDRAGIDGQSVEAEVAGLRDLGAATLRQRWREVAGKEAGPGLKGELLRAALAYRLQERAFGALPRDAVKRLDAMAREQVGAAADDGDAAASLRLRRIRPGSRLLREWRGAMHEVVVTPMGYLWKGEVHASLSAIARAITGTSWNGWRFFGVGEGRMVKEAPHAKAS